MAKKKKSQLAESIINGSYNTGNTQQNYSVADSIINGTYRPGSVADDIIGGTFDLSRYGNQIEEPKIQQVEQTVTQPELNENNSFGFSIDKPYERTPEQIAKNYVEKQKKLVTDVSKAGKEEPGLYDKLDYVRENVGTGLLSGLINLVDAPVQYVQEGAEKGKNKTAEQMLFEADNKYTRGYDSLTDDNMSTGGKILDWLLETFTGTGEIKNVFTNVGEKISWSQPDADKTIQNIRDTVREPLNEKQQELAKKGEKLSKGWQTAGEVGQSVGNMIPSIAASAITGNPNIGLATMGISAKGGSTYEAEQKGASLTEANAIGTIKGGVEVGTEKLTGGLNIFGKGSLEKIGEKGIDKLFKGKIGNFVGKKAMSLVGEELEETTSDLVDFAIDKATTDPDATYTMSDWGHTLLTTALTTGAIDVSTGGYSRSAYQLNTEQLQEVLKNDKIQKEVNNKVEQFKTPNMSKEQVEQLKKNVEAIVLGDVQNNINNVIENQLNIIESQNTPQTTTQTPLNEVNQGVLQENNQTPYQAQTPQITPLNEVNQELQETRQNDIANQVQAMNLEKQPEFKQKQGNYVYEKSENSKIDNLRKDMAKNFTESEETSKFAKTLEKIIEDKDVEIRFNPNLRDSQGRVVNGSYSDGVITLNPNSNRAGEFLAIHELTHAIGTDNMIKMVEKYRKSNEEFNQAVQKLLGTYNATEINEEALADISGQLFGNQEYINSLSKEQPSLFKRIYNEIKYLWHQFRGYKNQNQFIEDLRNKWESAYRNQEVLQKAKNSNIEMSTQTDSNGNMLSNEQADYFKNSKVRDENGNLLEVYHGTPTPGFTIFDTKKSGRNTSSGEYGLYFTDSKQFADDFSYERLETDSMFFDKKGEKGDVYPVYLNSKNMLDFANLTKKEIENLYNYASNLGKIDGKEKFVENMSRWQQIGNHQLMKGNLDLKAIADSSNYDGIKAKLNVQGNENEYIVFNSNQIKNIDNLTPTQDDDIRYSKNEELTKDNTGRELSKQQQDYFKNSKVVDEDGNLKHVYHGTASGEFTIFDKSKGNVEGDFGKGLYFTDNENDVNINYEDGGPDFENKVDRLAERIEQDEDISYDEAKEKARKQLYKGGYKFDSYLNMENPAVVGETRVFNIDDYNEDIENDLENEARDYQEDIEEYAKDYFGTDDISSLSEDDIKEARDEYFREQGIYDDIVNKYLEDDIENAVASVENELEMHDSSELRNLLWESVYDGGLEVEQLKNLINERMEISDYDGNIANNEATRLILESLGYDGIIDNTVSNKFSNMNMDSDTTHYIVFNPNQIKNVDNLNPTEDPDIRYSKDNQTWREYLEKEFPSQGTRTNLQGINERNKPKQENKTIQEEKPQEKPKNEVKQEVKKEEIKKSFLTNKEQQELDSLKEIDNTGWIELTKEEKTRMEELEKKSQGYTKKFPELKKTVTQEETKPLYFKYKDNIISRENNKILNQAKKLVESNTQGRRTKQQWLQIAEYIGANADIKSSQDLQQLAMETWLASKPNTKDNLNRQGNKYVDFKTNEWFNAMYKGAGVGTDIKLSQEEIQPKEKNIINKPKQDEVVKMSAKDITKTLDDTNKGIVPDGKKMRSWIETSNVATGNENTISQADIDKITYEVQSNKKTYEQAVDNTKNMSYEQKLFNAEKKLNTNKKITPTDLAEAQLALREAATKGDTKAYLNLQQDIAIMGTELGQMVQSLSMIQKLSPDGQLLMLQKIVKRQQKLGNKAWDNVDFDEKLVQKVLDSYDDASHTTWNKEKLDEAVDDLKQNLADQLKVSISDKVNEWRYLSMLGNPKTHIRNVVANIAMTFTKRTKEKINAGLQDLLIRDPNKKTATLKKASQEVKDLSKIAYDETFEVNKGNKYNEKNEIENKRKVFNTKVIETLRKVNAKALDLEDQAFKKIEFKRAFSNYLTAQNIKTAQDINTHPEIIQQAKVFALEESKIATFQQDNEFANWINKLDKKGPIAKVVRGAVIPFTRTPLNIAKTGIEYTPGTGLIKTVADVIKAPSNMKGNVAINGISKQITGTSLALLGYALAKSGIIKSSSGDDKEGKFKKDQGLSMDFSIKIGDKYYDLSWLSPSSMPLFIGASTYEQIEKADGINGNVIMEGLANTLDPLSEMSCISSFTDILNSYKQGSSQMLSQMGQKTAQNYLSQFVPTVSSQFARLFDTKKRTTSADKSSSFTWGQETQRQLMYKIPGLRNLLPEQTDYFGETKEEEENVLLRGFEAFLSPANSKKDIASDEAKEMIRVYDETGETDVLPSSLYKYIKYDNENYQMTIDEWNNYKKDFGTTLKDNLNEVMKSNEYKEATEDEKASIISNLMKYSKDKAKDNYLESKGKEYSDYSDKVDAKREDDYSLADFYLIKNESPKIFDGSVETVRKKIDTANEIGISIVDYNNIKAKINEFTADKDSNGKTINNSKKQKVVEYVNSLSDLSKKQKDKLLSSIYKSW